MSASESAPVGMDEERCYELLRRCRWPSGVTCVNCGRSNVTVHARSPRTPRLKYLCLDCQHTFTDLSGTCFARSKLPLHVWFRGIELLPEGQAPTDYARALGVKWESGQRMARLLDKASATAGLVRDLRLVLSGRKESLP